MPIRRQLTPPPAPIPLLDRLSVSALGAYSVTRKLKRSATVAFQLRRSDNNATADIGFVGAYVDFAACLAHCAGNSGFVSLRYDQTGNGNTLAPTSTSAQPRLVNAGAFDVVGNLPGLRYDGTDDNEKLVSAFGLTGSPNVTVLWAAKYVTLGTQRDIWGLGGTGTNTFIAATYYTDGASLFLDQSADWKTFNPLTTPTAAHGYCAQRPAGSTVASYSLMQDGVSVASSSGGAQTATVNMSNTIFVIGQKVDGTIPVQMNSNTFIVLNSILAGADLAAGNAEMMLHAA